MEVLIGALGGIGISISAVLLYLSTRKRDVPTLEIAKRQAEISGAQAASEAWAEYAKEMKDQVDREEARHIAEITRVTQRLAACEERWLKHDEREHGATGGRGRRGEET